MPPGVMPLVSCVVGQVGSVLLPAAHLERCARRRCSRHRLDNTLLRGAGTCYASGRLRCCRLHG
jgi:hypothetical protein